MDGGVHEADGGAGMRLREERTTNTVGEPPLLHSEWRRAGERRCSSLTPAARGEGRGGGIPSSHANSLRYIFQRRRVWPVLARFAASEPPLPSPLLHLGWRRGGLAAEDSGAPVNAARTTPPPASAAFTTRPNWASFPATTGRTTSTR